MNNSTNLQIMKWVNLLHIYQPPQQEERIIRKVAEESYFPILNILETRSKVKITLNICASLTEQLIKYGFREILERIKILVNKGQIELVGSACYHPILPLLPKAVVIRQIQLNEKLNKKYFGKAWKPKGFFLPELAYDKKTAKIIRNLGYEWIILDEIAFNGEIGSVSFDKNYRIKDLFPGSKGKSLKIIFRNRSLSLLFFGKWLNSAKKFFYAVKNDKRSNKFLITAFDGENLGHHRRNLINVWATILDSPNIESITCSKYLDYLQILPIREIEPIDCSWSTEVSDIKNNIPYPLWKHPKNELHQLQWQLTYLVLKLISKCREDKNYQKANHLLDEALASDQYWWASIKPWWNPGIIKKTVNQFSEIIFLLKNSLSPEIKNKAKEMVQKINEELERRIKSGHYKIIEKISDWK